MAHAGTQKSDRERQQERDRDGEPHVAHSDTPAGAVPPAVPGWIAMATSTRRSMPGLASELHAQAVAGVEQLSAAMARSRECLWPSERRNGGLLQDSRFVVTPPHGTVTFLFTDVEGSTRLWEETGRRCGRRWRPTTGSCGRLIEAHDGYVFSTAGDAFCAAF